MKVMLIQPPSGSGHMDRFFLYEPLGLEYLGAALKKDGHQVVLLDARLEPDYQSAFCALGPEVVGLTGYTNQLNIVKDIATQLKRLNPKVFVMVGGHHATVSPQDYSSEAIDLVVRGEGVGALKDLMPRLEGKRSFEDVPGLGIPGPEMRLTGSRPHPSLDDLPWPDRSLSAKYRGYYFSEWLQPLASIRTSLGCVSRCTFCALWALTEGRYLRRQPEAVVEELKSIAEEAVFFSDDESMADWQRMDRLADLIRESGIRKKFFLYARVDSIIRHPELFAKWKEIGLTRVFVGFESFTDQRLGEMKKGITVEEQVEAARILKDLKVEIYGGFMVDSSFSKRDFKAMATHIRRIRPTTANISVLTPLPGTELYDSRIADLTTRKPELYDILHAVLPTTLPLREFYSEYNKLFYRSTTVGQRIRTLFRFPKGRRLSIMKDYAEISRGFKRGYLHHEAEAR